MLAPTLFDDVDGQYRGMDLEVHQLPAGRGTTTARSRSGTPTARCIRCTRSCRPERVPDLVNCLIRMADESPAGVPVWPLQGRETGCMTGYHSAPVIAEALVKGFQGIDCRARPIRSSRSARWRTIIAASASTASSATSLATRKRSRPPRRSSTATTPGPWRRSPSRWARPDDYEFFLARSRNYRNLWDKSTGFIRPRLENGEWAAPFDPKADRHDSKKWRDFTEANSWQAYLGGAARSAGLHRTAGRPRGVRREARRPVQREHRRSRARCRST